MDAVLAFGVGVRSAVAAHRRPVLAGCPDLCETKVEKMTTTVRNPTELLAALETTAGGEIILAAGNYGELNLRADRQPFTRFASEVILKSDDPANPAVFAGVSLKLVKNLSFEGVKLDYDFADGDRNWTSPFRVSGCSHIKLNNNTFDGDLAEGIDAISDGYGTARGLLVGPYNDTGSDHITVTNNKFYTWMRAGVLAETDDLVVSGNDVHGIRSDGFNFIQVNRVRIEENHMHDFEASPDSPDHRDFIQFWTSNTYKPSTDIQIRRNILNVGEGDWTQAIFMRNEMVDQGRAGLEMFYQNVTIEYNVIHGAHTHGITVGECNGLVIKNNSLFHNGEARGATDGNSVWVPKIHTKPESTNVSIINNITPWVLSGLQPDWNVSNNIVVQYDDPNGENYVGDLFVNALEGNDALVADFAPVAGGLIDRLGVGALPAVQVPIDDPLATLHIQFGNGPGLVEYRRVEAG